MGSEPALVGGHARDRTELDRMVASVATVELPGYEPRFPAHPLEGERWDQFLNRCSAERLQGLLLEAVESDLLPVSHEQREQVRESHLRSCAEVLRLERRLLEVAEALEPDGVDLIVLKGSAHAHLDYPEPSFRMFGDVDVLVRGEDLARAQRRLGVALGATRDRPELRVGFDRRFAKSIPMRCPDQIEIDLHRHLLFGTFSFAIDAEELFGAAVPFELSGRRLEALGPEARVLHACFHAALGDRRPGYGSIRDIAQMLTAGTAEPRHVVDLATRWRSLAVLQRALGLCRQVLGVEIGGAIATAVDEYTPSPRERRAIASYVGPDHSYAAKVVASLPYLDRTGERASFLAASTLPSRAFIDRRRRGRLRWLAKGTKALRRRP